MKKLLFFTMMLFVMFQALGQQKADDIKVVLDFLEKKREIEDHFYDTAYRVVKEQIDATEKDVPSHAIWHSFMGELLSNYYTDNFRIIKDRSVTEGEEESDFKLWSERQLTRQIYDHYRKSIEAKAALQVIPIRNYSVLMDTMMSVEYRPTLYDFLAHRFIMQYQYDRSDRDFSITDERFLDNNRQFLDIDLAAISEIDDITLDILEVFQELTRFHLADLYPIALVDITLSRLQYYYEQSKIDNKDAQYEKTLLQFHQEMKERAVEEDILLAIGDYYFERGAGYNRETDTLLRMDYAKAVDNYLQALVISTNSITRNNATVAINSITKKSVTFQVNTIIVPQQPELMTVQYANCDSVYFRVIPFTTEQRSTLNTSELEVFARLPFVEQFAFKTILHGDYRTETAHYILPKLPPGKYVIIASPGPFGSGGSEGFCYTEITVSSIQLFTRQKDSDYEVFVTDRTTGEPVKDAELSVGFFSNKAQKRTKALKLKTDVNGRVSFAVETDEYYLSLLITVKRGDEIFEKRMSHYSYSKNVELEKITLFTDRNLYRPGQTVYYKGIIAQRKDEKSSYSTVSNYSETIFFKDVNYQTIEENSFTTNEFGSFSGSFTIPRGTQTGDFSIKVKNYTHHFKVEEYKRPQFEVAVEQPKGSYKLNEEVTVTGKAVAFAGYPIDGGMVKYSVTRSKYMPFRSYFYDFSHPKQIVEGEIICDENGSFTLNFSALPDPVDMSEKPIYRYEVSVDVTDLNGETQSSKTSIIIGSVSMIVQFEIPETVESEKSRNRFPLSTVNLNGEKQPAIIEYQIIPLEIPAQFKHGEIEKATVQIVDDAVLAKTFPYLNLHDESNKEHWKTKDAVARGTFNTATDSLFSIPNLRKLKEGYYRILLTTTDIYGTEIKRESTVLIHQDKSSKCLSYSAILLTSDQTTARSGEEVTISVGSYIKGAKMLYEVFWNDKVISSEWLSFDRSKKQFSYTIPQGETGKLILHALLVKDNFVYEENLQIQVPDMDKQLEIEWITFRDKTSAGSEEQWQLKIKGKEGKKVMAELLCTMYDASLDALYRQNSFQFPNYNIFNAGYAPLSYESYSNLFFNNFIQTYPDDFRKDRNYYGLFWSRKYSANRIAAYYVDDEFYISGNASPMNKRARISAAGIGSGDSDYMLVAESVADYAEDEVFHEVESIPSSDSSEPSFRSNFNETAFFYPHLLTDSEGNVSFSFTMPDALTKWNLQGAAHTKELKNVIFLRSVISQKPLMVVPNAPRFFREGDTIVFSTKMVNLHETELSGTLRIELFNALTLEPIRIVTDGETRNFSSHKGSSTQYSFKMVIPFGVEAIGYRIFASATVIGEDGVPFQFSDGEEKIIPVLSNRMLVTESLPLPVNGQEKKSFSFTAMKKANSTTLSDFRYTVEFTSNPVWYAIQALPYMMEYPYDCNEQIFSRIYANMLATHIVNSSPRIKEVFDSWQNLTPSAFCSNLEKNEELKSIVLEETPWILQAQSDEERKQQIATLFNIRKMADEKNSAITKLRKNQNSDGGWGWFNGGNSNRYITQYIVAGFGKLSAMKIENRSSETEFLLRTAIDYLDMQYRKDWDYLIKWKNRKSEEYNLSHSDVHYLYARSLHLATQKLDKNSEEMFDFYLTQAKKFWSKQTILGQGMLALVFYRTGDEQLAEKIVANIKSRAQYSAELGMFWKKEGDGWFWYDAPIERQALLIEAFAMITEDQTSVEKMQQWLLKQKQTQDWGTTKSTADACYALLLNGYDLLEQPSNVVLTIGKERIETAQLTDAEAGTGYFKRSWSEKAITPDMADLTVEKDSKGIAWGAAYWQYFEDLDKITPAQTPLSLQKELYLVTRNEQGELLTKITEENPIKVGDRVRVRLILKSDRDMEFVHLKDMRAAAFEPVNVLSQYKSQGGLWYYESTRDAATNFFFDYLPLGTYVFEYTLIATQAGVFSNGIGSIQSMYAPEFTAHSGGIKVIVKE